jgi:N-acetylglucosamine-6-phosphate deacetylase
LPRRRASLRRGENEEVPAMTEPMLLTGARVVAPDVVLDDGAVLVADGQIAAVFDTWQPDAGFLGVERADTGLLTQSGPDLAAALAGAERIDLAGGYLVPGLIDLHVHGAATASFDDGADAIATAVAAHRRHGTTATLVSLITADPDDMVVAIEGAVTAIAADPRILGIHLEGPFLADSRRGAHDPTKLLAPDPAVLHRFLEAGRGLIQMVTVAPELPGGLDLVGALVDADVHAAVGHSDAGYDAAAAAFAAGADIVTHAFNGMRPLHHRDPGIVAAAMDAGVLLEAINDGVHLHDATVRLLHAVAPGRLALVTDAMAAACAADGHYVLGSLDVEVVGGVARLATDGPEPGSIAGSTLTMDLALRRAVLDLGMDVVDAVNAASLVPARFFGVADRMGAIMTGRAADLLILDDAWQIRAMLTGGDWADERRP